MATYARKGWRQVDTLPANARFYKVFGLYIRPGEIYLSVLRDGRKEYHVHRSGGARWNAYGYHDCYIVDAHPNFSAARPVAKHMQLGRPWRMEDCLNLCQLAGLKWEWMKDHDEKIIYAAADVLGVDIG